jgi:diphthamide synthase (EF-2-diphthine--ammonia ligase)
LYQHTTKGNYLNFKKLQAMTTLEFKTMTKEQQLTFLNPLVEYGMNSMLVGTLKKNIVRHWLNKGLPLETAENLAELSELKAQEFKKNKLK